MVYRQITDNDLPASLALLHAWYMSSLISGFPSAMVSPTVTNLSTARFTACPTLATARRLLSEHSGRSLCDTNVEIWKTKKDGLVTSDKQCFKDIATFTNFEVTMFLNYYVRDRLRHVS